MISTFSFFKKILISFFVVLNIVTVLYANRPAFVESVPDKLLNEHLSQTATYNIRYIQWCIKQKLQMYGYLAGLGNHWIMFGYQNHFNWWYRIKAEYADGEKIILPLPRQSKRNFFQWLLFDLKETKLLHNIYPDASAREAYAKYLCRQYPVHNNSQVESIAWELYWQYIYEPKQALLQGTHLDPKINASILNVFECPEVIQTK